MSQISTGTKKVVQNITSIGGHENIPDKGLIMKKNSQGLKVCIGIYRIFNRESVHRKMSRTEARECNKYFEPNATNISLNRIRVELNLTSYERSRRSLFGGPFASAAHLAQHHDALEPEPLSFFENGAWRRRARTFTEGMHPIPTTSFSLEPIGTARRNFQSKKPKAKMANVKMFLKPAAKF